ncbi:hypothetical protein HanIR_Chr16g0810711 [Helianthus annuus]|nr:hypothetical protein HanIR_Chr16g0810711 [Helianthus annuus]
MPLSRSWKRADTSSNSLLRTSSPSRHLLAVRMINLSSSCLDPFHHCHPIWRNIPELQTPSDPHAL